MLEQLIRQNPKVADAVSRSRVVIETADRGVDEIRLLKNIHDALHAIESKALIPVRDELQTLTSNPNVGKTITIRALPSARRKFDQQNRDIQASMEELAKVFRSSNAFLEDDLLLQLMTAAEAFEEATNAQEVSDFDHLVGALVELGGEISVRLNDEIKRAMKQLEMQRLLELMDAVMDLLGKTAVASRQLKPMSEGTASLGSLNSDLVRLVRDHGLLQGLDNKLRSIIGGQYGAGTWDSANPASLSNDWKFVRRLRARFTPPFSSVFERRQSDLADLEAGIEAASARGDKAGDILWLINEYATEVGELFRTVDRELKDFCAKLRETTQPLKAILQQSEPDAQNV